MTRQLDEDFLLQFHLFPFYYRQESARQRKYLSRIFDRLSGVKFGGNKPAVVIFYGLKDHSYRVSLGC